MNRIAIQCLLLLFVSCFANAQSGSLDKTFGVNGVTMISLQEKDVVATDVVVLPDGKILQSGYTQTIDNGFQAIVCRFLSNGIIDSSFGVKGIFSYTSPSPIYEPKLTVYNDQRILLYGSEKSGSVPGIKPLMIRLSPTGQIDNSFGNNGKIYDDSLLATGYFAKVKVNEDGKIVTLGGKGVIDGDISYYNTTITRYTASGLVDSSFGINGSATVSPFTDTVFIVSAKVDANNNFVFLCDPMPESPSELIVVRAKMDGSLDSSFAEHGVFRFPITDDPSLVDAIHILPNNDILGLFTVTRGGKYRIAMVKITSSGDLDPAFGDGGVSLCIAGDVQMYAKECALDSAGYIALTGNSRIGTGAFAHSVFRFHPNGILDSTFGINGIVSTLPTLDGESNRIVIDKDGKYVACGTISSKTVPYYSSILYRVDPNAILGVSDNADKANTLISLHPTPSTDNCTLTYTLLNNSECTLTLRDESGREVKSFMMREYRTAGKHEEELDLRWLAAGVYFLWLEHDGNIETAKLIKR